ncbi:MAG TPA: hypothetical protein DEH27_07115 [Deltaproteobacteria bacterium]|nr:hypothetical protein [Deltaproteobacteria bacterium]
MAAKIKYTRKDLKAPDEFISTLGRISLWAKENRSTVLCVLAVVFVVLGAIFGMRAYYRWQETKAARDLWPQLTQARQLLQAPTAVRGEGLQRLEEFLGTYVTLHPGTRGEVFAKYYLGSIAYVRGDYERSAAQFRSAIESGKEQGNTMDFLLREGLAQALEAKGDAESAQKAYGEAAAFANGELRSQVWMGQARMLAIQGRKEEAAAVFRKILVENPNTPLKDLIEIKLSHTG